MKRTTTTTASAAAPGEIGPDGTAMLAAGWTPAAAVRRLRDHAEVCDGVRPDRAEAMRRDADAIEAKAGEVTECQR